MSKAFMFDISKCVGCYNCQLACKVEHVDNDWQPYAAEQPTTGHFWMKVNEKTEGKRPQLQVTYLPTMCNHCKNAPCIDAAKDGAVYRREDGLIIIDPEKAKGQKQIMQACPYGAIYWNDELDIPQKCTGCAHLLDNTELEPRCVDNCPTGALTFGEVADNMDFINGADVMHPEFGTYPQVFYRNIPGKFVTGLLFDPVKEEIVEGAKCRLTNGSKGWEVYSDDFGDFWFKDLKVGIYDLIITAPGYKLKAFYGLNTKDSVSLGDIALEAEE